MLRAQKCDKTFLKGPGRLDFWTSAMLEGIVAYTGDDLEIA